MWPCPPSSWPRASTTSTEPRARRKAPDEGAAAPALLPGGPRPPHRVVVPAACPCPLLHRARGGLPPGSRRGAAGEAAWPLLGRGAGAAAGGGRGGGRAVAL